MSVAAELVRRARAAANAMACADSVSGESVGDHLQRAGVVAQTARTAARTWRPSSPIRSTAQRRNAAVYAVRTAAAAHAPARVDLVGVGADGDDDPRTQPPRGAWFGHLQSTMPLATVDEVHAVVADVFLLACDSRAPPPGSERTTWRALT